MGPRPEGLAPGPTSPITMDLAKWNEPGGIGAADGTGRGIQGSLSRKAAAARSAGSRDRL